MTAAIIRPIVLSRTHPRPPDPTEAPKPITIIQENTNKYNTKSTKNNTGAPNTMGVVDPDPDPDPNPGPGPNPTPEPRTIVLQFTRIAYYVTPPVLAFGLLAQLTVVFINKQFLFLYITQIWYSISDILIIVAYITSLVIEPAISSCNYTFYVFLVALGCLSMANLLMTLYKFILIKYPLGNTNDGLTKSKHQLLWCIGSFIFVALVSSPILWLKMLSSNLGTLRGFCNYKGLPYDCFAITWAGIVIGFPMFLNLVMFLLIGLKVVDHKRKAEQRRSLFTTTTTMTTAETDIDAKESTSLVKRLSRTFSTKKAKVKGGKIIEVKTPNFPIIIIVSMILTVCIGCPLIPAVIAPWWFYTQSYVIMDILYTVMLVGIAVSPFVHLCFSKKTKDTFVNCLRNIGKCCCCCKK